MQYNLYSIRDNVAEDFGPLFQAINDGVAQRFFSKTADGVTHPDDYSLYRVGSWDSQLCKFDLLQQPFCVAEHLPVPELPK